MSLISVDFCLLVLISIVVSQTDIFVFMWASMPGGYVHPTDPWTVLVTWASLALLPVIGMLAVGCYASESVRLFQNYCVRFVLVIFIALVLLFGLVFLLDNQGVILSEIMLALGLSLIILPVARLIMLRLVTRVSLLLKVVLVGGCNRSSEIKQRVDQSPEIGIEVVGIVCVDDFDVTTCPAGVPVVAFSDLDGLNGLSTFVRECGSETIIAMSTSSEIDKAKEAMIACKLDGIHIQDMTSFYEQAFGYVDLDSLKDEWIIFADGFRGSSFFEYAVKRSLDILVSLLVLTITLPILLITGLCVKLTSSGPIFYVQQRVGYMGRPFDLFKFRTMTTSAEAAGPQFAAENDPRVTPVGRFLRRTRIDELPQLFNVLKGDMSFVGPRPERPFFVDQFQEKIPFYMERHYVKPGITGWAQLRYPYGASEEDSKRKLEYDLYYLKNYSLFLDVLIIMQTARVILFPEGVR